MKTILTTCVTAVICLIALPSTVSAEIYFCKGKWSSKACSENDKPIENLRRLSKFTAQETSTNNSNAEPPVNDLSNKVEQEVIQRGRNLDPIRCATRANKNHVKLENLRAVRNISESVVSNSFTALLRNTSGKRLVAPVNLEIYLPDGRTLLRRIVLANKLEIREKKPVSVHLLGQEALHRVSARFGLKLYNEELDYCSNIHLTLSDFLIVDNTHNGTPSDRVAFEKQIFKELREIQKDTKKLAVRSNAGSAKRDSSVVGDKSRLIGRLTVLCSRSKARIDPNGGIASSGDGMSSRIASQCGNTKRAIRRIGR